MSISTLPHYDGLRRGTRLQSYSDLPRQIDSTPNVIKTEELRCLQDRCLLWKQNNQRVFMPEEKYDMNESDRISFQLNGTTERPRLSVYRSNKHMYAQVIDDTRSHTLCSASTLVKEVMEEIGDKGSDKAAAYMVGKLVGERALEKGITKVCFDRGGYLYHGRVKAVADGARDAGLDF